MDQPVRIAVVLSCPVAWDQVEQVPSDITQADRILLNADFYAVNKAQPWVEAIAIEDGRIIFVGDLTTD